MKITLPETNIAPENGWLEYYFPFGKATIFRGELLVSGSVPRLWFQTCFIFISIWGFMIQIDERAYFSDGLVKKPPSRIKMDS